MRDISLTSRAFGLLMEAATKVSCFLLSSLAGNSFSDVIKHIGAIQSTTLYSLGTLPHADAVRNILPNATTIKT